MSNTRKTLVLEAALAPGGAALVVGPDLVAVREHSPDRGERLDLLAAARQVLAEGDLRPADLSRVVVGTGPGSFTSLRTALGLAQGLAAAVPGLVLAGVDSPRILAEAASARLPVWVAIPWGRLRVLVVQAARGGPAEGTATLVARDTVARLPFLRDRRLVAPVSLASLEAPRGARLVTPGSSPVRALARLTARDDVSVCEGPPAPLYLAPPDAILPPRNAAAPPGWSLVELDGTHLPDLLRLERACFTSPWSASMLREELTGEPDRIAIGMSGPGGRIAAAALARLTPDALAMMSVAVAPEARGRGLARTLVRELVARGRQAGSGRADLEVRKDNAAAIALYAGEGFAPVGLRRRYYHDGTDAVLMSLALRRS